LLFRAFFYAVWMISAEKQVVGKVDDRQNDLGNNADIKKTEQQDKAKGLKLCIAARCLRRLSDLQDLGTV